MPIQKALYPGSYLPTSSSFYTVFDFVSYFGTGFVSRDTDLYFYVFFTRLQFDIRAIWNQGNSWEATFASHGELMFLLFVCFCFKDGV